MQIPKGGNCPDVVDDVDGGELVMKKKMMMILMMVKRKR